MRRREFISALGSVAAAWPLAARAQQAGKLPIIGFLGTDATAWAVWTAAFVQRLRELGWIEGRNVVIEYRWAQGRPERVAGIAAEFVRLGVNVIITGGVIVPILRRATSVIPIVFAIEADPVGKGIVASLARPGGNVTGLSLQGPDVASKRFELLHEVVPHLRRLAIMADVGDADALLEMAEVQSTARTLGLEVALQEIRQPEDIAPAFDALKGRVGALYVVGDPLTTAHQNQISSLALAAGLPMMSISREFVQAKALMSYGANIPDMFRRAADFADKILRGTKPADIPVEQPTKFELVINLKTAKALGLTIPPAVLAVADEVIE